MKISLLYTHTTKKSVEKIKENGMYEANVVAERGNGHFPHVPIPFILYRHVGGRLQLYTRKWKVGRPKKKKTEAEKTKGEGEERHKKNKKCIKSWGRQEAAHGLKCMEINIKLSLAPLLAANKGPASSPCLHGL